jgi:DNA-binding NarL/FixJ family response regulator
MVAPIAPPRFRPWVILLVDDEPDVLASIKTLAESSIDGLKVITATSGRIGLELLDRERIDVIVSDFKMPGMDGIEFLYQCRRHQPRIPRVMLTAFGNEDLARRAVVDAFVSSFLSKGADPEEIVAGVAKLLDYVPSSVPPPPPLEAPAGSLFPRPHRQPA